MANGERTHRPERIAPILPPIHCREDQQKQDVVQRFGVDDVMEAEGDERDQVAHGASRRARASAGCEGCQ